MCTSEPTKLPSTSPCDGFFFLDYGAGGWRATPTKAGGKLSYSQGLAVPDLLVTHVVYRFPYLSITFSFTCINHLRSTFCSMI